MNRRVLVFSLVMAFTAAPAVSTLAQTSGTANHATIEKQIVVNERAINDAIAKGDMKGFHANLAADAVSVDGSGIMKVNMPDFDKMMQTMKIQSWNLDGSQFYWVDDSTVVHMYRWTGKGTYQGQAIPSPTWASTVWTNKGGKWLATFHQESLAMTPPPAAPAKK